MNGDHPSFDVEVRRQIQRLWITVIVLGAFAIAGIAVGAFGIAKQSALLSHKASNSHVQSVQHKAALDACIGVNITRATDNRSHWADYKLAMKVIAQQAQQITFTRGSLHADYVALAHVGIGKRVLNQALAHSLAQLRSSEAALRSERDDASAKTWTTFTNCAVSTRPWVGFHVYLISQRRPPKSAMEFLNAQKPNPTGSLPRR